MDPRRLWSEIRRNANSSLPRHRRRRGSRLGPHSRTTTLRPDCVLEVDRLEQFLRTDLVLRVLIRRGQPPLLEITHELVQRIRHLDEEVVGPQICAHRIVPSFADSSIRWRDGVVINSGRASLGVFAPNRRVCTPASPATRSCSPNCTGRPALHRTARGSSRASTTSRVRRSRAIWPSARDTGWFRSQNVSGRTCGGR